MMNPSQLDEFRQQLDARYQSLRDEVLQDFRHLGAERYQDIAVERLQAYPSAKRCHACQTRYEKTHARSA